MLEVGKVVYFVEIRGRKPQVRYGIITAICEKAAEPVIIDFLEIREHRYVKGIPIEEFTSTQWRKIPKEWREDSRLIETGLVYRLHSWEQELLKKCTVDNPEGIKELYDKGILVTKGKIVRWHIETEINRNNEYRIVKKIPHWTITYGEDKRTFTTLPENKVYLTYKAALEEKKVIEDRWKAEAALSDYEWSVREIDKVLRFFPETDRGKYREKLLSMENVDDLEIRKRLDKLEYRYFAPKSEWRELVV